MARKTNKTEHVLNLLTNHTNNEVLNPLINEEFKHEMIHTRQASESSQEVKDSPKNIKVDILEELVEENIDAVIERFNVYNCEEYRKQIIINALRDTKPVYVDVENNNLEEVKTQKGLYKNKIISNLVKCAIKIKSNSAHIK